MAGNGQNLRELKSDLLLDTLLLHCECCMIVISASAMACSSGTHLHQFVYFVEFVSAEVGGKVHS